MEYIYSITRRLPLHPDIPQRAHTTYIYIVCAQSSFCLQALDRSGLKRLNKRLPHVPTLGQLHGRNGGVVQYIYCTTRPPCHRKKREPRRDQRRGSPDSVPCQFLVATSVIIRPAVERYDDRRGVRCLARVPHTGLWIRLPCLGTTGNTASPRGTTRDPEVPRAHASGWWASGRDGSGVPRCHDRGPLRFPVARRRIPASCPFRESRLLGAAPPGRHLRRARTCHRPINPITG